MADNDKPRNSPLMGTHAPAAPADQAAAAGADPSSHADGAQLPSMPDDQLGFDDLLPLAKLGDARKGAGRPVGSTNKRSEMAATVAIARYGDPLKTHVALGNMPLRRLIPELRAIASDCGMKLGADVTVFALARFQQELRREALPYLHGKKATTDDKGQVVVPVIGIGHVENFTAGGGSGRSIEDEFEARQTIDITPEKASDRDKSHKEKSHDEGSD